MASLVYMWKLDKEPIFLKNRAVLAHNYLIYIKKKCKNALYLQ
jgi:hypothetical protein